MDTLRNRPTGRAFLAPLFLLLLSFGTGLGAVAQEGVSQSKEEATRPVPGSFGPPTELHLTKAGSTTRDLRTLPQTPPKKFERPELEEPEAEPVELPGGPAISPGAVSAPPVLNAPAPPPIANFDGLDFANWGAGHPPDTNGDVGPSYFIQTVNTSIGIYQKSTGTRVAAFTFNTFMSQGAFGNLCDTNNFGDPVVLYDTFEDRWVITDFAFQLDGSNNVINPPGAFQCFAVSKTADPVAGGWNFYSINVAGGLGDYPKFGIWPDGIYMSTNVFGYPAGASFQNPRVYAFNKAQMYAGSPTVQVVTFNAPSSEFTLLPANARLQTGTPPLGSPNYYAVVWQFLNVVSVYKFHVDWDRISTSTFTGPFTSLTATSWSQFVPTADPVNNPNNNPWVRSPANLLDTLYPRLMMQNQYTNLGGVESLWDSHTVGASGTTSAQTGVRYYQVKVTGGAVEANASQAFTWSPDATINRFMPSVAVDRAGDMAIGYSASSSTLNPALRYAGRLAADPVNSISQTETSLFQGTGSQQGSCGGTCTRWGDYSAMSLDPDGCTFWYTNMYYAVNGLNDLTRIGSFTFPSCTPVGAGGTVSGTVTATVGGAPINGATVMLGNRTAITNGSGVYSFTGIPAGTYPSITASFPGYVSASASNIVVTDGNTTTQDFSLGTAPTSACLIDTTQADLQTGVPTNVDLTASPGDARLTNPPAIDQQNTTLGNQGAGFTSTTWLAQTFTVAITGPVLKVDVNYFSLNCASVTMPNVTVSIRNAAGNLPTGADLAVATIPGFCNGAGGYFTATFASPVTLTAGTQYALVWRAASAIPGGTPAPGYFATVSVGTGSVALQNPYSGGRRASSANSGTTWAGAAGNANNDHGFRIYVDQGFTSSGNLISSLKDSNPPPAYVPFWTTLSWTASVPANTNLQFQVAASNSQYGPFNFVGPDGTAATFFTTSGASLSQFNGFRYLRYKALMTTANGAVTPTINDVTLCFNVVAPPDVSITKTDGVTTAVPGGSVTYTVTASNPSALAANPVTVADTFPAVLTCTWTCTGAGGGTCTASGAGNINDTTVNLPAGASVTYTATCAIAASATGSLSNTATATFASDPNAANNSATDTDTLAPQANLGITKTDGVTTATPGGSVTYTITASNAGPSNAPGATVADTFPASLTCTWTCAGAGGGTCTASGSGNVNDTVNLPSGGSVTYTASCTISAAATGTLSNTATVAAPGGVTDPTPGNNSATDSDTLAASADLAITKTDGVTTATPGGSVTYTITASQRGSEQRHGRDGGGHLPGFAHLHVDLRGRGRRHLHRLRLGQHQRHRQPAERRQRDLHGELHDLGRGDRHPEQHGDGDGTGRSHRSDPGQQLGHRQ